MNIINLDIEVLKPLVEKKYLNSIIEDDESIYLPLVIDLSGNIIDGNKRYYFLKEKGEKNVNVFQIDAKGNLCLEYINRNKRYRELHIIEESLFVDEIINSKFKINGLIPRDYDILHKINKIEDYYLQLIYRLKIDRKSLLNLIFLPFKTLYFLLDMQDNRGFSNNEFRTITQNSSSIDFEQLESISAIDNKAYLLAFSRLTMPVTSEKNEKLKKINSLLPKKCRILNRNNFEIDDYELNLNFRSIDDLLKKIELIKNSLDNSNINTYLREISK